MRVEEISKLIKSKLDQHAAEDCHVFLWTTVGFLIPAIKMVESWGFPIRAVQVWRKKGGVQPQGYMQYNGEYVIYAQIGKPKFIDTKDFWLVFDGERRGHASSPRSSMQLCAA